MSVAIMVETIEQFFARLKKKHSWNDERKIEEVLSDLLSKKINTVEVLNELWEEVKSMLPLSIGIERGMAEEMKRDALVAEGNPNIM